MSPENRPIFRLVAGIPLAAVLLAPQGLHAEGRMVVLPRLQLEGVSAAAAGAGTLDEELATAMVELGSMPVRGAAELERAVGADFARDAAACQTQRCAAEICARLGASHLLAGSVRRLGKHVVVSLLLIEAETGDRRRGKAVTRNERALIVAALREALRDLFATPPTPTPDAGADAAAPTGMVLVPAGEAWIGCAPKRDPDCQPEEQPRHRVRLDAFFIDRTEVTVGAYRRCVEAQRCTPPDSDPLCNWVVAGRESHPVTCVTWRQARDYCAQANERLPSEAEWEKAARGDGDRLYPWGDQAPTCARAVWGGGSDAVDGCGRESSWPVGSKAAGASPYGVLDMGGNVVEWVADWYGARYYAESPQRNPPGPATGDRRIAKGGNWVVDHPMMLRISQRDPDEPDYQHSGKGFRCAQTAAAARRP